MKKLKLILLISILSVTTFAQEFAFHLYFEDSAGNKDSVTFGYDPQATNMLDQQFDEVNIIGQTLNENLDVRFSDFLEQTTSQNTSLTFQSKKQITFWNNYDYWNTISSLEIKCKNWPVTAYWDSTLFDNLKFKGSIFTSMYPGGWFDVAGGPSNLHVLFKEKSSVTFTKNYRANEIAPLESNSIYSYISGNNDSISVFYMALADLTIMGVTKQVVANIEFFPNPAVDFINIKNISVDNISKINIWSATGQAIPVVPNDRIDISNLKAGLYLIDLEDKLGNHVIRKFSKR